VLTGCTRCVCFRLVYACQCAAMKHEMTCSLHTKTGICSHDAGHARVWRPHLLQPYDLHAGRVAHLHRVRHAPTHQGVVPPFPAILRPTVIAAPDALHGCHRSCAGLCDYSFHQRSDHALLWCSCSRGVRWASCRRSSWRPGNTTASTWSSPGMPVPAPHQGSCPDARRATFSMSCRARFASSAMPFCGGAHPCDHRYDHTPKS